MHITYELFKKLIPDAVIYTGIFPTPLRVSINCSSLEKNQFFVICNDNVTFLYKALSMGAGVIVSHERKDECLALAQELKSNATVIGVADPLQSVYILARYARSLIQGNVVAITGSLGLQEMVNLFEHVCAYAGKTVEQYFSDSNSLDVAVSLINYEESADTLLYSLAIKEAGSLKSCVELLQPTTGVIVSLAHTALEQLGSLVDVATHMRELFTYFKEDTIGIINGDYPFLSNYSYPHPVIRFGRKMSNQIQARKIKSDGIMVSTLLKLYGKKYPVVIPAFHEYVIESVLAALSLTHWIGIEETVAVAALQQLHTPLEECAAITMKKHNTKIIADQYTPSPESMKSALRALQLLKSNGKKIAVLSDMPGLGKSSAFWHRQLGRFLRKTPSVSHLILVGNEVEWTRKSAPAGVDVEIVASWNEVATSLQAKIEDDSVVLIKGSGAKEYKDVMQKLFKNDIQVMQEHE